LLEVNLVHFFLFTAFFAVHSLYFIAYFHK
jgi:hypothetical protein